MKHLFKRGSALFLTFCMAAALPFSAAAHPGKVDSNGGHRDNKNASGLGSYHYHCGNTPAHLHKNGVCPYGKKSASSSGSSSGSSSSGSSSTSSSYNNSTTPKVEWKWQKTSDGRWVYTDGNAHYKTGWLKEGTTYYYLDADGYMKTGWVWDDGVWYYLEGNGAMISECWKKIDGYWYYFFTSGEMATGWLVDENENYYYCSDKGQMLTGTQEIDYETYTFDESGHLIR